MKMHLEMTDTMVDFYEDGRVVESIPLTQIYQEGYTFEEFCELQRQLGREAYFIREGEDENN